MKQPKTQYKIESKITKQINFVNNTISSRSLELNYNPLQNVYTVASCNFCVIRNGMESGNVAARTKLDSNLELNSQLA